MMSFEEWFDENRQELSTVFDEEEVVVEMDWEDFIIDRYEDYLVEINEE